ncbi:MAG: hypothetical protein LBJ44_09775, partial [Propionibacteriaceae bacterium]|nr:hypothetical protein [Propionibacteriaceae bacterium]
MSQRRFRHGRPRAWLAGGVCGLSGLLVLSLVGAADSFARGQTELHDSGVWVTNEKDGLFGRINKSAIGMDAVLGVPGDPGPAGFRLDVHQDGSSVVLQDVAGGRLVPVDALEGKNLFDDASTLPPTAQVSLGGGSLATLDTRSGDLKAVRYETGQIPALSGLDVSAPALATLEPSGRSSGDRVGLAVGQDGVVYAVSTSGEAVKLAWGPAGFSAPERFRFAGQGELTTVAVTVVGDRLVVADPSAGRIWLPDGQVVDLPEGAGLVLQKPGPAADRVWLATSAALIGLPLDGGQPDTAWTPAVPGPAGQPVVVAGCAFGAWAGWPADVVRSCDGGPAENWRPQEQVDLGQPIFRVNRGLVLLNDGLDGQVFDIDLGRSVDHWTEVQPPVDDTTAEDDEGRRRSDSPDPTAVDDVVGLRPGRMAVAHVLDNDSDAMGRVLVVQRLERGDLPEQVGLSIAPDGQTIQVDWPADLAGAGFSFRYQISNGVGQAWGQVSGTVHSPEVNSQPELRLDATEPVFPVAAFGGVALNVLADWRDPDSDAVSVTRAEWDDGQLPVTGDGQIHFVAGRYETTVEVEVRYWVSDGVAESQGTALVHILTPGDSGIAPVGHPDVVRAQINLPVRVRPLDNDLVGADPAQPSARLTLAGAIPAPEGVEVRSDPASGQVEVTSSRAGTFFLNYSLAFGSAPFGSSFIRVDVVEETELDLVAVRDQVAVRGQVPVTVDVLANDWDPRGSVLTVVRVEVDRADQLRVAVVDGRWVRVMPLVAELTPNPAQVRYVVTDGAGRRADGVVLVTQLPAVADGEDVAVVNDDWARVRVGDQVLVPVLGNDASVSGLPLVIDDRYVGVAAGELSVVDPSGVVGRDVGRAFV